ncbi:MAG: amine dehydrogenase [Gammaproteobacteria bacterium]|nr:amine dehydrogenase [Gammaproteobacteria bacterium]
MIRRFYLLLFLSLGALPAHADLPNDPLGLVNTLPAEYPDHWLIAHDVAFANMLNGRIIILDTEKDTLSEQYKGMINSSLIAMVAVAKTRPEIYVYESFYSRGTRGTATDVLTIHDKTTLKAIDEIVIPGVKRADMLPSDFLIHLIDNEKYLLLFNFTPATSVAVIDVENRKLLNEVNTPSCSLIYPTGKRGFSSLCSDASMISYQLDEKGKVKSKTKLEPFFDIDGDALFERPVIIDGIAYFPTFQGNLKEIDLRGSVAKPGKQWSLLSKEERKQNWRPGGMNLDDEDSMGHMYLLMHPEGEEGTHKNPGAEVWVYDVKKRKRTQRIPLKLPGLTIEVSKDNSPRLFVTNVEMNIDVYDALSGEYLKTLSDFGQETPLILFSAN